MAKKKKIEFGEWQNCPRCNGFGVSPFYGYMNGYPNPNLAYWGTCDVCNGAKIIQRPIINQQLPEPPNTK